MSKKTTNLRKRLRLVEGQLKKAQGSRQAYFRGELLRAREQLDTALEEIKAMKANNLDTTREPVITVRRASHPAYARGGQTVGFQVYMNTGELQYMVHQNMSRGPFITASSVFSQLEHDVVRQLREIFTMAVAEETGLGMGYKALKK